jgi:hypothetical protein
VCVRLFVGRERRLYYYKLVVAVVTVGDWGAFFGKYSFGCKGDEKEREFERDNKRKHTVTSILFLWYTQSIPFYFILFPQSSFGISPSRRRTTTNKQQLAVLVVVVIVLFSFWGANTAGAAVGIAVDPFCLTVLGQESMTGGQQQQQQSQLQIQLLVVLLLLLVLVVIVIVLFSFSQ